MEYNNPSEIVKDLNFNDGASSGIMNGVKKLAEAVGSTLGASGKCVIYEDTLGKPIITKDGVTVAKAVVLPDPLENIGATLIKEAAENTVREAGDGTTTATVLAYSLLRELYALLDKESVRDLKKGVDTASKKVFKYLDNIKVDVTDDMLSHVASISCNNDEELGGLISEAYTSVGKNGVVLMEESESEATYLEFVDGIQFDSGLKSQHLATDDSRENAVLDNPCVLIMASEVSNIRTIQNILEFVIKNNRPLLIVSSVAQQPMAALIMNKVKGNLKVNIVDLPGFGSTKRDTIEDLASLTGATVIDEGLGDDIDALNESVLGTAIKSVTNQKSTTITIPEVPVHAKERIDTLIGKIKDNENPFIKKKLEQRLSMLSGSVGIVKVGADSEVELKEKKDRIEDAIYATKAALQEGIVPGGGVALLNASVNVKGNTPGEIALLTAIEQPYETILTNSGLDIVHPQTKGMGIDVKTGKSIKMVKAGIIDPVMVTKTALKNAISVATTIISTNCVISNIRL